MRREPERSGICARHNPHGASEVQPLPGADDALGADFNEKFNFGSFLVRNNPRFARAESDPLRPPPRLCAPPIADASCSPRGPIPAGLRQLAPPHLPVRAPELAALARKTSETVHLGVLDRSSVVYLQKVDSPYLLRISTRLCGRLPGHCRGTGKIVLAYQPSSTSSCF